MEQVRNVRQYLKKRYVMYFITTILILTIPFIRINGNHIFLLSFDHKQLHLLGVAFDARALSYAFFVNFNVFSNLFYDDSCGTRLVRVGLSADNLSRVVS